MSVAFDRFQANDLRKSARTPLSGTVTVKGVAFQVMESSFTGFKLQLDGVLLTMKPGELSEVVFTLRYNGLDISFHAPSKLVWCADDMAGFAWDDLPVNVKSVFQDYLRKYQQANEDNNVALLTSNSFLSSTRIEPEEDLEKSLKLKRNRRVKGIYYLFYSLVLLGVIAFFTYENRYVFSNRAIYTGNLIGVTSSLDGRVDTLYVKEGDLVHKNQLVARLDVGNLRAQRDALNKLVMQRSTVVNIANKAVMDTSQPKAIYSSVAEHQLAAAKANVAEAYATYVGKKSALKRALELDGKGVISRSEIDILKADADSAMARYKASQEEEKLAEKVYEEAKQGRFFNGTKVDNDLQVIEVNMAQRQAELAQAELELARLDSLISQSSIVAANDGKIFSVEVEPGQYIKRGDQLIILEGKPVDYIVAKFTADDAASMHIGSRARVYIKNSGEYVDGEISAIGHTHLKQNYPLSSLIESTSGEVLVEVALTNVPAVFYPGSQLEVKVNSTSLIDSFF